MKADIDVIEASRKTTPRLINDNWRGRLYLRSPGIITRYRFEGNGFSTGAGGTDIAKVDDGREPDNDVYYLDANLFDLDDGPGNDRYDLVGDLLTKGVRDGIIYGDTEGRDRVTFVERE